MTNRPSVAPADRKRQSYGGGGGSTDQKGLRVQFPVGAGSSHIKDN